MSAEQIDVSNATTITVDGQGAWVNGAQIKVPVGTDPATAAVHHVARTQAHGKGGPVPVVATEESGSRFTMMVHPDGRTTHRKAAPAVVALRPRVAAPQEPVTAEVSRASVRAASGAAGGHLSHTSFLSPSGVPEVAPPATAWQALLQRLGLVSAGPTEAARMERVRSRAVAQRWPGPRSIAVINGKGGAGKTPTAIVLAALFARLGGSGVLAWDCNVTRGTLGWRTEQGPHDATVLDLVGHTDELMSSAAQLADLGAFVHHQTDDMFDVLRSNPLLLSTEQKLTADQRDAVHAVARKFYRLTVMDSGNDEGDELWLRMVDASDRLVVATTTRVDHAEAARLLLLGLRQRDAESARKAEEAVVIVSQADRSETDASRVLGGFEGLAGQVVTVPYDTALRQQWLHVDALSAASRTAWLAAAAAVAEGL